jgi:hypothetical protein
MGGSRGDSGRSRLLLQVHGTLQLFNQHVEDVLRYHWLTFEALQGQNRDVVEQNIPITLGHALDQALRLAALVAQAIEQPDFRHVKPSQVQVEPPPVAPDRPGVAGTR